MIGRTTSRARFVAVACAMAAFVLLAASPALGARATQEGYSSPGVSAQGQVKSGGESSPTAGQGAVVEAGNDSAETLPFTGLELGAIVGVGVVLLLVGFALRRATTRPRLPGGTV